MASDSEPESLDFNFLETAFESALENALENAILGAVTPKVVNLPLIGIPVQLQRADETLFTLYVDQRYAHQDAVAYKKRQEGDKFVAIPVGVTIATSAYPPTLMENDNVFREFGARIEAIPLPEYIPGLEKEVRLRGAAVIIGIQTKVVDSLPKIFSESLVEGHNLYLAVDSTHLDKHATLSATSPYHSFVISNPGIIILPGYAAVREWLRDHVGHDDKVNKLICDYEMFAMIADPSKPLNLSAVIDHNWDLISCMGAGFMATSNPEVTAFTQAVKSIFKRCLRFECGIGEMLSLPDIKDLVLPTNYLATHGNTLEPKSIIDVSFEVELYVVI